MQLLESNERTKWFVWRKWGRVGTHMGSSQKNEFKKLEAAIKYFEKIYLSKTQNKFGSPTFEKQPGKYYPIDVAHDVDKNADLRKLAGSGVELQTSLITDKRVQVSYHPCPAPPSPLAPTCIHASFVLQNLIELIFNIDKMEKTLLELEIDTEKMPLGNLSESHIRKGVSGSFMHY